MKRKFITNLAFLLLLNILIKPFWVFGIDRTVQNTVGPEVYGWYYALFNLSLIFNIILDIGITTFNNREIARDHRQLSRFFSALSGMKFLLAGIYSIIVITTSLVLGYETVDLRLLFLLIINQFLASFLLYLRSNISGMQLFMTDSMISVLDRLLVIIFCGSLLWIPSLSGAFRIEWFILSQTAGYLITIAVAFIVVFRHAGSFRMRLNFSFSLSVMKKSTPYALLFLLMALYNWIGPIMLSRLLGDAGDLQNGIYAQAFRLLDFLSMFGVLMAGILLPMFARMLHQAKKVNQLVQFSFLVIFIPSFILAVSFIAFHREIMQLLYHSHALESSKVFFILMIGFPAVSTSYVFGTLLTANGNMKALNLLAGSLGILAIVLNILLVPVMEARGAAIACVTAIILSAVIQVILSIRIFDFRVERSLLLRLLLFATSIVLAAIWISRSEWTWGIGLAVLIGGGMGLAFLLKLFDLKEIFTLFLQPDSESENS